MKIRFAHTISISALMLLFYASCDNRISHLNVVFILVDDLGWTDLGCYGSTFHETPNIDRLASSGMLFTDAYSSSPVCSPTRASIMTGKHPARINITDWIPGLDPQNRRLLGPADKHQLPLEENTIAEAFRKHDYKTFFAGKWHLGDSLFFPEQQGFDINFGGHHRGQPPGGYYSPYKNPKLTDGPEGEYLTDRLTDESIRFINESGNDPFFLFLSYYTVHTPIQASVKHVERYRQKLSELGIEGEVLLEEEHLGSTVTNQVNPDYASMIAALDENIGRLLDELDVLDLMSNTIVIFTSDNGGLSTLGRNRVAPTSVKPLRAGKGWCYEGGIRVPLIIKSPGMEGAGERSDFPVMSYDLYPTLLELADFPLIPSQHMDGRSLVELLDKKNKPEREAIFWHFPHYHGSTWTPGSAIRLGDWKLIQFYDWGEVELYNLKNDLGEENNITSRFPGKTEELRDLLDKMLEDIEAKLPAENPSFPSQD